MLQEYHTGHIRMGDLNLTDAALGGQRDGVEAAELKFVCGRAHDSADFAIPDEG